MLFAFRTDASFDIGTGHVTRSLTLAKALRKRDAQCYFICREHEGNLIDRIREESFEVISLPQRSYSEFCTVPHKENALEHAPWLGTDWQTDTNETVAALNGSTPDWLVVDHYALDFHWEQSLRSHCKKIMVIDDLADRCHDCDLLLDQNLIADFHNRYKSLTSSTCATILGPKYALLQSDYAKLHCLTPPRLGPVKRVLIYFGGTDCDNLTGRTISAFLCLNRADIALDVVVSPQAPHAKEVHELARDNSSITIHQNLPSLATLITKADLAIGASGATSWERCCLGLPTIVVTLAKNQEAIASELDRLGLVRCIGDKAAITIDNLKTAIKEFIDSPAQLFECSLRCRAQVDGRGTDNVVDILLLNTATEFKTRQATVEDEPLVQQWTNESRSYPNLPHLPSGDPFVHRSLFFEQMRYPEKYQRYVFESASGFPIGAVSFEKVMEQWEIDYQMPNFARNCGLEIPLAKMAISYFRNSCEHTLSFRPDPQVLHSLPPVHQNVTSGKRTSQDSGLSIAICTDQKSWINKSVPTLILNWLASGHHCEWAHDASKLAGGDICFYLSYSRIVSAQIRSKYRHNLVVHASDLPKGRGWSPASWMILEGQRRLPVTLLEAEESVDSGAIYSQDWFEVQPTDLVNDWREKLSLSTINLVADFVANFPTSATRSRPQTGEATYYPRRRTNDSRIDPTKSLSEQFTLLQIVDNDSYPAWFLHNNQEFIVKIFARST